MLAIEIDRRSIVEQLHQLHFACMEYIVIVSRYFLYKNSVRLHLKVQICGEY